MDKAISLGFLITLIWLIGSCKVDEQRNPENVLVGFVLLNVNSKFADAFKEINAKSITDFRAKLLRELKSDSKKREQVLAFFKIKAIDEFSNLSNESVMTRLLSFQTFFKYSLGDIVGKVLTKTSIAAESHWEVKLIKVAQNNDGATIEYQVIDASRNQTFSAETAHLRKTGNRWEMIWPIAME